MKLRDEIRNLAAAFGSMAADLKNHQDKLMSHARGLEAILAERTAELAHEKDSMELSVAERITQLNATIGELRSEVAELSKRNREITLLSKMNDYLQTSTSESEAYAIIAETVTALFPEDSGAVFVLSASRDMLEAAGCGATAGQCDISAERCWAHRRDRFISRSA
jgi:nitrate/nitrite-specific signal transduction histidine kinase